MDVTAKYEGLNWMFDSLGDSAHLQKTHLPKNYEVIDQNMALSFQKSFVYPASNIDRIHEGNVKLRSLGSCFYLFNKATPLEDIGNT